MRLVFLGAPGSGKGTQAALLVQRFGLGYISTGDVFRKAIADQTDLGQKAAGFLDDGLLVPDEIVLGMIDPILEHLLAQRGFILDGFPRTVPQAKAFQQFLEQKNQFLDAVLNLEISESILSERLLARKRADDTEETIRIRLQIFHQQTEPLKNYYQNLGLLRSIEASGSVEEVHGRITQELSL